VPGAPGTAAPGIPRWNPPVAGYPVSGRSRKGLWIGLGIGAVCVAGVIIAVVAIPGSNQSGSAGTASPAASSGASSGSSVQPPDGFAYKKLLTGAGVLPAGWKIGGESDSGADASTPNTDDVGISAVSCQDLGVNTASMLLDYQSSYAELNVDSNDGPGDTPDVSLNGFLPGNATKALADVRKLAARCHTFSGDSTSPGTYTTTVAPVSVSGADQALVVEMTTPSGSSDFTDAYWLFAQYGNTIVGADELTWSPSESGDTQHFPSMAASLGNKVGQASANG
jgi:hypothetical protein